MKCEELALLISFAQLLTHNLCCIHNKINEVFSEYALRWCIAKDADYFFCEAVFARIKDWTVIEDEARLPEGCSCLAIVRINSAIGRVILTLLLAILRTHNAIDDADGVVQLACHILHKTLSIRKNCLSGGEEEHRGNYHV